VRVKLGRVVIGFKQRDVENRGEARKIKREMQLKCPSSNSTFYGVRTKPAMIEFVRWSRSFDIALEEPDELPRLNFGGRIVAAVISARLNLLCTLQLSMQLSMSTLESGGKICGGGNS
jgi:hypothetical protein